MLKSHDYIQCSLFTKCILKFIDNNEINSELLKTMVWSKWNVVVFVITDNV